MGTSAVFGAKNFNCFEIYGVSARTRRVSQCGHYVVKEGGVSVLWTGVFCRRPLNL